ncbi:MULTISPECIES: hypothetical protein [unclassified Microcoleus]|uniref:hypothetical protein n=1 Tax=unclassified Microcoleus TaxID=2642155 RepID=UPI002FD1C1EE
MNRTIADLKSCTTTLIRDREITSLKKASIGLIAGVSESENLRKKSNLNLRF